MIIKYEKEINHCYECPFTEKICSQGFSATCCQFILYGIIPEEGIQESCPFKEANKNENTR